MSGHPSAHSMEIHPNWLLLGDPYSAGPRGLKMQSYVSSALSKPDTQQPPCQGGALARDVTPSPLSFLFFLRSRKSRMCLGLHNHFPTAYVVFNFLTINQHFCIFSIFRAVLVGFWIPATELLLEVPCFSRPDVKTFTPRFLSSQP